MFLFLVWVFSKASILCLIHVVAFNIKGPAGLLETDVTLIHSVIFHAIISCYYYSIIVESRSEFLRGVRPVLSQSMNSSIHPNSLIASTAISCYYYSIIVPSFIIESRRKLLLGYQSLLSRLMNSSIHQFIKFLPILTSARINCSVGTKTHSFNYFLIATKVSLRTFPKARFP